MAWTWILVFVLHALRAACVPALLAIPRNHPEREFLLALVLLFGLATDLIDGAIARALGITGWQSIYWGDHGADMVFFLGAFIVIGGQVSMARDLPQIRRTGDERRAEHRRARWRIAGWVVLIVSVLTEIWLLMLGRMFREL